MKAGNHLVEAKLGFQDLPFQNYPNQRMDMTENQQWRLNLRHLGNTTGVRWKPVFITRRSITRWTSVMTSVSGMARFRTPGRTTRSAGPARRSAEPRNSCAAGMPMDTESRNTGLTLKADIALGLADLLRVGGEYQHYRLDDWWPPSGGGMWPYDFININDGKRDRAALFGEWEATHSPQWMTLIGVRYEHVTTDAGKVHGCHNLAMAPTSGTGGAMGRPAKRSPSIMPTAARPTTTGT